MSHFPFPNPCNAVDAHSMRARERACGRVRARTNAKENQKGLDHLERIQQEQDDSNIERSIVAPRTAHEHLLKLIIKSHTMKRTDDDTPFVSHEVCPLLDLRSSVFIPKPRHLQQTIPSIDIQETMLPFLLPSSLCDFYRFSSSLFGNDTLSRIKNALF